MGYKIYNTRCNEINGKFILREDSSDKKSIDETWIKKAYRRPSANFIVDKNETWLDLGANIGAFTCYAALCGAKVHAYEPQKDNVAMILKNAELNGVDKNITVNAKAIVQDTEAGKILNFYESTNPKSYRRHTLYGNYLNSANKKKVIKTKVETVGFTALLKETKADCVKMNIEGAEIPIITELKGKQPIKKMVFEYSFDMDKRIKTYIQVIDKLNTMFDEVIPSRKIPLEMEVYPYWPPNVYIFCINK